MYNPLPDNHRYKQLDSLRGLAALTVFIGHSIGSVVNTSLLTKVQTTPLSILFNGYAAVMFFFVLSGFVLSLPFINNEKPLSLTAFYTKRFFRIYPAFLIAMILSVVLKELVYNEHTMANSLLWFKQYWAWHWDQVNLKDTIRALLLIDPGFNKRLIDPPVWSLVVEVKMSIILPFFILIVSRCGALVNVGLFFLISYLAYRHTGLQVSVFFLGVILAKYQQQLKDNIKAWPMPVLVVVMLVSLLLYNAGLEFLDFHLKPSYVLFSNYLPAIGSCMIIITVLASKRLSSLFERKVFVFLGVISYSFYLMHFPVLMTMFSIIVNRFAYGTQVATAVAFVITVLISYFMTIFIERQFRRLASRLVKKHSIFNTCNIKATGSLKAV
ncbi:acyltransferase [Mucilaginibacter corticis]|uniref:Acyltransferase n=1 Tax=Mucilaginibacter corticis TaxID=2597670 RepID=A0A556MFE6_9SPHI|nr:acyltransferase [Mucilaginibacter corticis]TSJ38638.1 acyltransferase [Mucilaginibacter corticis]